jgi:hypothetical protein
MSRSHEFGSLHQVDLSAYRRISLWYVPLHLPSAILLMLAIIAQASGVLACPANANLQASWTRPRYVFRVSSEKYPLLIAFLLQAWYTQNLQISIPVTVVAGLVAILILWFFIRSKFVDLRLSCDKETFTHPYTFIYFFLPTIDRRETLLRQPKGTGFSSGARHSTDGEDAGTRETR